MRIHIFEEEKIRYNVFEGWLGDLEMCKNNIINF